MWPLEAENVKKMGFPWSLQEGMHPTDKLGLAHVDMSDF